MPVKFPHTSHRVWLFLSYLITTVQSPSRAYDRNHFRACSSWELWCPFLLFGREPPLAFRIHLLLCRFPPTFLFWCCCLIFEDEEREWITTRIQMKNSERAGQKKNFATVHHQEPFHFLVLQRTTTSMLLASLASFFFFRQTATSKNRRKIALGFLQKNILIGRWRGFIWKAFQHPINSKSKCLAQKLVKLKKNSFHEKQESLAL